MSRNGGLLSTSVLSGVGSPVSTTKQLDDEWVGKKVYVRQHDGVYSGQRGIVIARITLSHRSDDAYKLNGVYVRLAKDQVVLDTGIHVIPVSVSLLEIEAQNNNFEFDAIKEIRKIAHKNGRPFFALEDVLEYWESKKKR